VLVRLADDILEAMVHGGPGIRAAVEVALGAHGFAAADGADDADAWSALAAAPSPAALRWLLADPARTPPFRAEFLRRAPVVLISGPANAGKSTLLNAWCGRQRALVSDVAGTTRDLVAAETLVEGWRLRLVDSAGLRASDDPLECAGQELVERARAWADLVLHLEPPEGGPGARPGDLVVLGKADLRRPTDGLRWSSVGVDGAEPARLLERLGAAVLDRLGLAPP
jgi:tRNA modification GTPase